jgi:hypothetical protein
MKMNRNTKLLVAIVLVSVGLSGLFTYAVMVANYVIPSSVTVTTAPGITCYNADGSGVTSTINWGDLQVSTSKSYSVFIMNTGGASVWLVPSMSLTAANLPSGLTLTWDLAQATQLTPGQETSNIALTLTATTSATMGVYSFTITVLTFGSSSG